MGGASQGRSTSTALAGVTGGGGCGAASDMTDPDSLMALLEELIFLSECVFSCSGVTQGSSLGPLRFPLQHTALTLLMAWGHTSPPTPPRRSRSLITAVC